MGRILLIRTIREAIREAKLTTPSLLACKNFVDAEFEAHGVHIVEELSPRQASNTIARGVGHFVKEHFNG